MRMSTSDRPKLTAKQKKMLDFIANCINEQGLPPTIREIGDELGIKSPNGVMCHIKALEHKGYIYRDARKSRSIWIVDNDPKLQMPLLGSIPAGQPWTASALDESFDLGLLRRNHQFLLRVVGFSMVDAGILDGDLAIIRPIEHANDVHDGQAVAAMIDGDVTLKLFYRESATVARLVPANTTMPSILAENVQVIGVLAGVIRNF